MNRQPCYYDCRETGRLVLKKALVVAVFALVIGLIFISACWWANAQAGGTATDKREIPHVRHF